MPVLKEEYEVPRDHITKETDIVLQVREYLPKWVTLKLRPVLYMEIRQSSSCFSKCLVSPKITLYGESSIS